MRDKIVVTELARSIESPEPYGSRRSFDRVRCEGTSVHDSIERHPKSDKCTALRSEWSRWDRAVPIAENQSDRNRQGWEQKGRQRDA